MQKAGVVPAVCVVITRTHEETRQCTACVIDITITAGAKVRFENCSGELMKLLR